MNVSVLIHLEKPFQCFLFGMQTENKNERVVCVKNLVSEDVLLHATRLRNALGRKVKKLPTRHVTKHPSVQGTWTTDVRF
jgi:large subunit ribosomal protein L43